MLGGHVLVPRRPPHQLAPADDGNNEQSLLLVALSDQTRVLLQQLIVGGGRHQVEGLERRLELLGLRDLLVEVARRHF